MKIRLGFVPNPFAVACHVAASNGFFSEDGIEAEIVEFRNGSRAAEALDAGDLDFSVGGHLQTIAAVERGSDQVFIAPLAYEEPPDHLCIALLAPADGPRSARELADGAVAVSAAGAISELQLRQFMRAGDADYDSLRLVAMPFSDMARALGDKTVAAASAVEPFVTQLHTSGIATVLDRGSLSQSSETCKRVMITGIVARRSWIDGHRAEVRAVAAAIGRSIDFVRSHETEARTVIAAYTGMPVMAAQTMALPAFREFIDPSDLQPVIDLAVEYGMLTRWIPADDLIDTAAKVSR
jgi:NitT/TauT family transport system substrate-binding protein